jgi:TonB family protein
LAPAVAQQKTVNETTVQPGTQTTTTWVPDFDVKIDQGEFLVRRKGTLEWKRSSQFSEPVTVGFLDSNQKIYVATKSVKPPKATHMEDPDYPASERNSGKEGRVSLHIVVDDHGAVRDAIVDAGPGPEFAKASIAAVKKWTFQPAKLNGQAVAVLVSVTMQFQLY